jgi:hypothetical protein
MLCRSRFEIEYCIETPYFEGIAVCVAGWRTGTGIPDTPKIIHSLHRPDRIRDNPGLWNTRWYDRTGRQIPDDPWRKRATRWLEWINSHYGDRNGGKTFQGDSGGGILTVTGVGRRKLEEIKADADKFHDNTRAMHRLDRYSIFRDAIYRNGMQSAICVDYIPFLTTFYGRNRETNV